MNKREKLKKFCEVFMEFLNIAPDEAIEEMNSNDVFQYIGITAVIEEIIKDIKKQGERQK